MKQLTSRTLVVGIVFLAVACAPHQVRTQAAGQAAPQQSTKPQPPPAKAPAPGTQKPPAAKPTITPAPVVPAASVPAPPGYVIGPEDVLQILFWREKDWSAEVVVRPDGLISLPQLNDVQAAGLTPEQLRDRVNEAARKFFKEDPDITVVVKQINSRKVFITGQVGKPGPYALTAPTTVLQLISMAGGLNEFAKRKNIVVMRTENGKQLSFRFNYDDVIKRKNLKQNIELAPGDTVIVP